MPKYVYLCVYALIFWILASLLGEDVPRVHAACVPTQVVSSPSRKRFQFYIDDVLRTETSSFLGQPWSPEAVSANFTICGLVERVGARLELGDYPLTR